MIKNWKYVLVIGASFATTTAFSQSVKDGQRATDLERYKEATRTLQSLSKSNNEEASLYLADAYLRAGKTDSATMILNQAAGMNAKSAISMVAAGKAALLKGNMSEAESKFEDAVKAKKKDPQIYKLIGQAYADANVKDVTKALDYLNKANELAKNKDPEIFIVMGDVQQLQPNGGGPAMTAYDRALQIDSKNAKAHFKRGQLYVRSRNFNEAQTALQAAITADANYAPAYRELAEMYYFAGKYDQALENMRKYISMSENTPDTRAKYASFLFLTKDYAGTIKEAQEVLARDPKNAVMNRVMAYSLYETEKNAEALTAMENYFKVADPAKVLASDYAYYGRMLAAGDKAAEAQANFDKALAMDATNVELMDDIASFYVKQKDYAKAISLYTKIIAAQPKNLNVYNVRLADAYFANQQFDEADSLYSIVLKANPTYAHGLFQRARIADEKDTDKSGDAKPLYEEFIKVVNQDPSKVQSYKGYLVPANYLLGFYAYKGKDYATARKYWQDVLKLDPANKEAKTGIANLDAISKGARR
ncbi:tetratricopeptide repeat protein [Adhaeribacter rhizoryzae]|uniref:Tetratricopeptide repeat protein n=1 Tax=Adhaeribacter rhizoryzae TaxID=2607907 RepID=A0A5M6D8X7_9BACT|nr:tetratricopeptide repeat protein [Adhaeribacter rhizoryzae]KAA5543994.1 tetratricopeptide repeat protein [Adhaeribacter rhizoryzae]